MKKTKEPTLRVLMATSDKDVADMKKAAKVGKPPMYFSLPKGSNKGGSKDDAVIFTHEGLHAYAKILTGPDPDQSFGKRPVWRAKVGEIQLVPFTENAIIEKRIPEWKWINHPRRSFCTPDHEIAQKLRELVNERLGKNVASSNAISAIDNDTAATKSGAGYQSDKAKRDTCENYAMNWARKHYEKKGFTVETKSTTHPFDLLCINGAIIIHVEVKGTTTDGSEVELTIGEVKDARNKSWRSDLFVVSNIELTPLGKTYIPSGGEEFFFANWRPEVKDLEAIRYRYKVPASAPIRNRK